MAQYADAVAVRDEVERTTAAAAGTKRGHERGEESGPYMFWEKRRKGNFWEDAVESTAMAAVGAKRSYERDEEDEESDVISVKRYKCNYWEDPAYAEDLQRWGSSLAQMAALDIDHDRLMQEVRAWNSGTQLGKRSPVSHPPTNDSVNHLHRQRRYYYLKKGLIKLINDSQVATAYEPAAMIGKTWSINAVLHIGNR